MPFSFKETGLPGVIIVEPRSFEDERGFFLESYKKSDFISAGIDIEFMQDNHSFSSKDVLRGLHFQNPPFAQAKLIRVIRGTVFDVAVDIRRESPYFKEWVSVELSGLNRKMIYVPEGFAHGFLVLSDEAHIVYKCSSEYSPEHDAGIIWNDPDIGIEWPVDGPLISGKDMALSRLRDIMRREG